MMNGKSKYVLDSSVSVLLGRGAAIEAVLERINLGRPFGKIEAVRYVNVSVSRVFLSWINSGYKEAA